MRQALRDDSRGLMSAKAAVALVVGLAILGILASIMLPVAINALSGDASTSLTTADGETDEINAELNATLDSVDDTAGTATFTLQSDGQSEQNTIDEGSNATYSFDRGDVIVTVDNVESGNATATYEYPRDFSYSGAASALWAILGLVIVLAALLYVISMALDGL